MDTLTCVMLYISSLKSLVKSMFDCLHGRTIRQESVDLKEKSGINVLFSLKS